MAEAALDYDQLLDQPPLEIPPGGIANFLTATSGSWADDEDIPRSGIAEVKKVADKLAEYGRHEDEYMVHAAEGETVVPMAVLEKNPKLKVLSVASLLGEAILRIHQETSVSSLFDSTRE